MKNSKFWIWFIPLLLILCALIYLMILNINKKEDNKPTNNESDAIKIKNEYESKNDNIDSIKVKLSENNSYVYLNDTELNNLFNNNDGIVFIGDSNDNNARSFIMVLEEAISSTSIPKVYYIDIHDNNISKIKGKVGTNDLYPGTVITFEDGNVLESYFEVLDHDKLLKSYNNIIKSFIEACDENC